jgi:hypothetical protein
MPGTTNGHFRDPQKQSRILRPGIIGSSFFFQRIREEHRTASRRNVDCGRERQNIDDHDDLRHGSELVETVPSPLAADLKFRLVRQHEQRCAVSAVTAALP